MATLLCLCSKLTINLSSHQLNNDNDIDENNNYSKLLIYNYYYYCCCCFSFVNLFIIVMTPGQIEMIITSCKYRNIKLKEKCKTNR